jgi:2-phosphosulfolactate phosphatase
MPREVLITSSRDKVDLSGWATIVVDVIRATTTVVTAVAQGRRCLPAGDVAEALVLASQLEAPLLAGELGGSVPPGFDLDNSPAAVAERQDFERPLVLVSSSGTRLLRRPTSSDPLHIACLRNYSAQADYAVKHYERVALLAACSRGEFREEDQLCCAWIAAHLLDAGYMPQHDTESVVARWRDAPVSAVLSSNSASFLERTGRQQDLEFVLGHVDDVHNVFSLQRGEVIALAGQD